MEHRRLRHALISSAAGSAALLLAGCALPRGSAVGSAFVAPDARHLRLPGSERRGVIHRAPLGDIEYDRAHQNGRAEALLLLAKTPGKALDMKRNQLEQLTEQWRFVESADHFTWRQPYTLSVPRTSIDYRLFERASGQSQAPRQCAAFIRTWDLASADPLTRPKKAYFGYTCAPVGQTLSEAQAQAYLRHIRIISTKTHEFRLGQAVAQDAGAKNWARGSAGSSWGLVSFPPNRIRRFPIGGANGVDH